MQRRKRSVSHKFEDQIAAERTRLEEQIAKLRSGAGRAAQEDQAAGNRPSHQRVGFVS
jgi:cell division protein FtsB